MRRRRGEFKVGSPRECDMGPTIGRLRGAEAAQDRPQYRKLTDLAARVPPSLVPRTTHARQTAGVSPVGSVHDCSRQRCPKKGQLADETDIRRAADGRGKEAHRSCARGEWREGFGVLWSCGEAGNACNDALLQDPESPDRSAALQAALRPARFQASAFVTKSETFSRVSVIAIRSRRERTMDAAAGTGVAPLHRDESGRLLRRR